VLKCWKRFDHSFNGEEKYVNSASANSYRIDMNWYSNTGATDHITSNLRLMDKLVYLCGP
jgi:hypothetical protein